MGRRTGPSNADIRQRGVYAKRLSASDLNERAELDRKAIEEALLIQSGGILAPPTTCPHLPTNGLYAIADGDCLKIGIARDAHARLGMMQVGNPRLLTLVLFEKIDNAAEVERQLHSHFWTRRVRGEWFAVSIEEVRAALERIAGILVMSEPPLKLPSGRRIGRPPKERDGALRAD